MKTFEIDLRCKDCGHTYTRKVKAKSELDLETKPNPPCPKCKKVAKQQPPLDWSKMDRAPAAGGSDFARAADLGAEMVMQDYGLTNIKGPTEVKQGERTAPRLAPALQDQADNFFGGASRQRAKIKIGGMDINSAGFKKAVIGGAFSNGGAAEASAAIAQSHARRDRFQPVIINKESK